MDHTYTMNPMKEFIENHDSHVKQSFEEFKETHSRQYESEEHERRLALYQQNMRFIHSKNRAGLSYREVLGGIVNLLKYIYNPNVLVH